MQYKTYYAYLMRTGGYNGNFIIYNKIVKYKTVKIYDLTNKYHKA